jgi:hypothetical protein
MINRSLTCLTLAASLAVTAVPVAPALADGAASTRDILIGGAAAAATLLIINHNKQVHAKYAEYDRRQAETEAQANNAEAAYESERQAYGHEAALVASYRHEVAVQHAEVLRLRQQLAMSGQSRAVAAARLESVHVPANAPSYGWGSL